MKVSSLVFGVVAAVLVAISVGNLTFWLVVGVAHADGGNDLAMAPMAALIGATLFMPLALLLGFIPAFVGVIGVGLPIHLTLAKIGRTGLGWYALAGALPGLLIAGLVMWSVLSSEPSSGRSGALFMVIIPLVVTLGGAASASAFRLVAGEGPSRGKVSPA